MIRYCVTCQVLQRLPWTAERVCGFCDFCGKVSTMLNVRPAHLLPRSSAVNDMLDRKRARS